MLVRIVEIVAFNFLAIVYGPDGSDSARSGRSAKHVTKQAKHKRSGSHLSITETGSAAIVCDRVLVSLFGTRPAPMNARPMSVVTTA